MTKNVNMNINTNIQKLMNVSHIEDRESDLKRLGIIYRKCLGIIKQMKIKKMMQNLFS